MCATPHLGSRMAKIVPSFLEIVGLSYENLFPLYPSYKPFFPWDQPVFDSENDELGRLNQVPLPRSNAGGVIHYTNIYSETIPTPVRNIGSLPIISPPIPPVVPMPKLPYEYKIRLALLLSCIYPVECDVGDTVVPSFSAMGLCPGDYAITGCQSDQFIPAFKDDKGNNFVELVPIPGCHAGLIPFVPGCDLGRSYIEYEGVMNEIFKRVAGDVIW